MFWKLFGKKEKIYCPEFISMLTCDEFMDATTLLSSLNEQEFNNTIRNDLKLIEIKNLDLFELKQNNVFVSICLFLSDKKDKSKTHDKFKGGDLIGKIDALTLKQLCLINIQIFGRLGLKCNNKNFILDENLNKYLEFKLEPETSLRTLTYDCMKFADFFSKTHDFLTKLEKSKLQRSNVSFLISKHDPRNQYISIIEPNQVDGFFTGESLLEAVKFSEVLNLQKSWKEYLKILKLDTIIEKSIIEKKDIYITFYLSKKGIDIKSWAKENEIILITEINSDEFLNQAQFTSTRIKKLMESIENNTFISTPQIDEYLIYQMQNGGLQNGTNNSRINFYAKRYLEVFDEICRPISQLNKSELSKWEVLVTTY
jgi:hypothetical protein